MKLSISILIFVVSSSFLIWESYACSASATRCEATCSCPAPPGGRASCTEGDDWARCYAVAPDNAVTCEGEENCTANNGGGSGGAGGNGGVCSPLTWWYCEDPFAL